MGDGSSRSIAKTLRNEWSLFWEAFQGEEETLKMTTPASLAEEKIQNLNLDEIRQMTKVLVEERKKLNQKMESLSKEIDLNMAKLESLRLAGIEEEETLKRVEELNDLGQAVSTTLTQLDIQLRRIRAQEDQINEEALSF